MSMGQEQKLLSKHIHVTMQKSYLEHNIQCAILVVLVVRDYKIDSFFVSVRQKEKNTKKGVPYKGFFETLKFYRKLHFQAVKRNWNLD